MAGYGIQVQTNTGHFVWLTKTGTTTVKAKAMKFDSETGAEMYRKQIDFHNPHATFIIKKF